MPRRGRSSARCAWSSISFIRRDASQPAASPMPTLLTTVTTTVCAVSAIDTRPLIAATVTPNSTSAVPSLNRLSPSTSVARRRGAPRFRKVAMTATGSVAATIAPTTMPSSNGRPVARFSTTATIAAETRTPGRREQDHPAERLAQLGELEAERRLEHETGHEHEQDELGRDLDRAARQDRAGEQAQDDEGHAVRARAGAAPRPP